MRYDRHEMADKWEIIDIKAITVELLLVYCQSSNFVNFTYVISKEWFESTGVIDYGTGIGEEKEARYVR